ncbi:MAG: HIT family hydrolase [Thermoplasmata archaeon]|nr:MAG: HIT family hydrolase [Thermoprotei archaeon]RLF37840.1 MAG: HIT family hydrolase [Thermoplasmata archaeon]
MDILWAPWRMKYIEYEAIKKHKECIFCIAAKTEKMEDNLVLHRTGSSVVLMNLYPYNTGHLLVAPKRHVASTEDLSKDELQDLFELLNRCLKLLRTVLRPDGFNIGINLRRVAGAGIEDHVHIHVVPRWNGDTNFMPVISNTKVIPEALKDTYKRLLAKKELLY